MIYGGTGTSKMSDINLMEKIVCISFKSWVPMWLREIICYKLMRGAYQIPEVRLG